MQTTLKVEYLPTSSIKPYKFNPRIHNEKQVRQLMASITAFNFNNPLLIDSEGELIAGHGRLMAAQQLKMETVPVIRLSHLTPYQKRLYRIADNKLTLNGDWDVDLLKFELSELETDFDVGDLTITGFATGEIDILLNHTPADERLNRIPFIPPEEVVSAPGDIWTLGKHKIICGNALEESVFQKLMGGEKADMVFTDPPYNLSAERIRHNGGGHKSFAMAAGEMSVSQFKNFLNKNASLLAAFSKDGAIIFTCIDWRHVQELLEAVGPVYTELKNIATWVKDHGGMGSLYRSRHEFVTVHKNGKSPHTNNIELGVHGRYRTNVWEYTGVGPELLKIHPTVKPVELIEDAIFDVSNRGEIVLDAFLGSGSTLIAAEKTRRVCRGIELEPLYVDTAIRRWETLTGKDAVHAASQKTYKQAVEEKKNVK